MQTSLGSETVSNKGILLPQIPVHHKILFLTNHCDYYFTNQSGEVR